MWNWITRQAAPSDGTEYRAGYTDAVVALQAAAVAGGTTESARATETAAAEFSAGLLVLQRRINWRGDSCEEIEPSTAPLRSFHDS